MLGPFRFFLHCYCFVQCVQPRKKFERSPCSQLLNGRRRRSTSRKWLCECSKLWHSCNTHAIMGHACGTLKRRSCDRDKQETKANKKPRDFVPPPESGKSSSSSASVSCQRPPSIELVKPLTKPGPKILAKFPHLFHDSSSSN